MSQIRKERRRERLSKRQFTPVESMFLEQGNIRGGLLLFSAEASLDVILTYRDSGYEILGLDAFTLFEDGSVQPSQEHSIDFTSEDRDWMSDEVGDNYDHAIALISRNPPHYCYEVVMNEPTH